MEPHTHGRLVGPRASEGLPWLEFLVAEWPLCPSVPRAAAEPHDRALSHAGPPPHPPQAPPTGRRTTSAAPRGWAWWSARGPPAAGRRGRPCRSSCAACSSETGTPATPWAWTGKPGARTALGRAEVLLGPGPRPCSSRWGPPPTAPPRLSPHRGSKQPVLTSPAQGQDLPTPGPCRLLALGSPDQPLLDPASSRQPSRMLLPDPQSHNPYPQRGPLKYTNTSPVCVSPACHSSWPPVGVLPPDPLGLPGKAALSIGAQSSPTGTGGGAGASARTGGPRTVGTGPGEGRWLQGCCVAPRTIVGFTLGEVLREPGFKPEVGGWGAGAKLGWGLEYRPAGAAPVPASVRVPALQGQDVGPV